MLNPTAAAAPSPTANSTTSLATPTPTLSASTPTGPPKPSLQETASYMKISSSTTGKGHAQTVSLEARFKLFAQR